MKSIKGSKFFTITSGDKESYKVASETIEWMANTTAQALMNIMPCKLVKVEIISFDRTLYNNELPYTKTFWVATGLMIKLPPYEQTV